MNETHQPLKKAMSPRRQVLFLLIGLALFGLFSFVYRPATFALADGEVTLSRTGQLCLGLLLLAIFYWITEALPFHITALLVLLVMPVLRITDGLPLLKDDGKVVTAQGLAAGYQALVPISFGDDLILFFLGVFLLSAAFTETPLGKRLTLRMLRIIGTGARTVLFGFLLMGDLLSMWVSDVGVAALMLPIALSILRESGLQPLKSNFGRALMIAVCWGAIFGGIGTPAGCGPNTIAIGFMRDLNGMDISFLDWMKIGVPAALILVPAGWLILLLMFPPEIKRLPITREDIDRQLRELGKWTRPEIGTVVVFAIVIFLWVFNPLIVKVTDKALNFPISYVSILGGLLLFLPPFRVLTWDKAEKAVSWSSILLIMASLGLGMMTYHTGAAKWIAVALLGGVSTLSPVMLIFVVVLAVIFMKLFLASNTVTGIVILPLMISLAQAYGIDAWILVGPAAFTSSLGIILVTQTPTNIIPYTSGYFTIKDFAKSGVVMSLVMAVLLALTIAVVGPLSGMYNY